MLVAFTLAFLSNIPQQQKNSGIKIQRANLGCRSCYINSTSRSVLNFDIFRKGRYYNTIMYQRYDIDTVFNNTKKARDNFATRQGLDASPNALVLYEVVAPTLDIIISRPGDLAYSKFQGLVQMLYKLLLKAILILKATKEYTALLRIQPFPLSQLRVQGLLYYLKSYTISEYTRQLTVIPVLLQYWLQKQHIRKYLLDVLATTIIITNPVGYICSQYTVVARSNSLLISTSVSKANRADIYTIVYRYRTNL